MRREMMDTWIAFFAKNPVTKYKRTPKIPNFIFAATRRGKSSFRDPFFLPRARILEKIY